MIESKVSIIIPVYNGGNYMREAIDSALAQTYKNIEVIVVNDGSTDSTDEIARSYGDKIVYIKKENGGVSTALNLALEKMTGDYFSWLSHDDRYYPQKIEKEIDYLNANGLLDEKVILYSNYDLMDSESKVYATSVKEHDELMKKPEYCLLRGAINGLTLLIPKRAFNDCGNFREDLRCTQDYELWNRMMHKGYKFIHIPEVLVAMRMHSMQQGNTSPLMLSEGNELWIDFIKQTNKELREKLEESEYIFMKKMYEFMLTTPYDKAAQFAKSEFERIKTEKAEDEQSTKVTVCIPDSGEGDVCRAVESVRLQTYSNIELLVISGGYVNQSKQLKEAISKIPQARFILCEESSMADICNIAINESNGEYIAFLDPCDTFSPEKIKRQVMKMIISVADFSHTDYLLNNTDNCTQETVDTSNICGMPIPDIIIDRRIAFSTVMFRTGFLRDNGLMFKDSFMYGGDICFYIDSLEKTEVLAINEALSVVTGDSDSYRCNASGKLKALKTVLRRVLNDPELSKCDYQISRLSAEYISYFNNENVNVEILQSLFGNFLPEKQNPFRRTLSAIKHRGILQTLKAGFAKIKRRIARK